MDVRGDARIRDNLNAANVVLSGGLISETAVINGTLSADDATISNDLTV